MSKPNGIFKKAFLGGFNKSDVLAYFDKMSYQYEQDKKDLNAQIDTLTAENQRISDEAAETAAQLANEQNRAQIAVNYSTGLRTELTHLQELNKEKDAKLEALADSYTALQAENDELKAQNAALKQTADENDALITTLRAEVNVLSANCTEAQKSVDTLTARLEAITAERLELEEKYKAAVADAEASAATLVTVSAECEQIKAEAETTAKRQLADANNRLAYINDEFASFKDELHEIRRLTADALNTAERKLARIETSVFTASQKLGDMQNTAALKNVAPVKRTQYLNVRPTKNTLFDSVTSALDALVDRWSR